MAAVMIDSHGDHEFGHFEEFEELEHVHETNRNQARNTWLHSLSIPSNRPRTECMTILNTVHIVNPSVSVKVESARNCYMNISSCINGIRLIQLTTGAIQAEFQIVFCCGSISYSKWKYLEEFKQLAKMVQYIHRNVKPIYTNSINRWESVEKRVRNYFGCYEMTYLVDQSCRLGAFIQELLMESPDPRLLLMFVKHNDFIVE